MPHVKATKQTNTLQENPKTFIAQFQAEYPRGKSIYVKSLTVGI